jgi:uncharacterized protein (TIGR02246 family)
MNQKIHILLVSGLGALLTTAVWAQESSSTPSKEGAIRDAINSYVVAFNARDAEALVAHWSPNGVYTSRTSGEQVTGREAMAAEFIAMFAGEDVPQLSVTTDSIEFISPNVALERGRATVTAPDESVSETSYSVVFVKRDGQWLIDRVTEEEVFDEPSNYEHLKGLEWMLGNWIDEEEGLSITTECNWTRNQNFISRIYEVTADGEVTSSGLQVIGWDASQQEIRSWLFDSSGSIVQGIWKDKGDRWTVQSVASLADGSKGSFTSIFRPIDENSFCWQKVNRVRDGEILPNIDEVIVTRQ